MDAAVTSAKRLVPPALPLIFPLLGSPAPTRTFCDFAVLVPQYRLVKREPSSYAHKAKSRRRKGIEPGMQAPTRRRARARVLEALTQAGSISRADLARRTALAPSTVSAIVGELEEAGLVVEAAAQPPAESGLGRPAVAVALGRRAGVALGIDFGKRHVRVALADLAHTVLAERAVALEVDRPAGESIDVAVGLVDMVLGEAGASRDE